MQPFMGIGVVVEKGKVASGCETWAVKSDQGYFDAAIEGITTTEQAVTGGNPGQIAMGQQVASGKPNEGNSRTDRDEEREEDNNPNTSQPAVAAPAGPPRRPPRLRWEPPRRPPAQQPPSLCRRAISKATAVGPA